MESKLIVRLPMTGVEFLISSYAALHKIPLYHCERFSWVQTTSMQSGASVYFEMLEKKVLDPELVAFLGCMEGLLIQNYGLLDSLAGKILDERQININLNEIDEKAVRAGVAGVFASDRFGLYPAQLTGTSIAARGFFKKALIAYGKAMENSNVIPFTQPPTQTIDRLVA